MKKIINRNWRKYAVFIFYSSLQKFLASNHIHTNYLKKICIKAYNHISHSLKPNEHQTAQNNKAVCYQCVFEYLCIHFWVWLYSKKVKTVHLSVHVRWQFRPQYTPLSVRIGTYMDQCPILIMQNIIFICRRKLKWR